MYRAGSRTFANDMAELAAVSFEEEYAPRPPASAEGGSPAGVFRFGSFVIEDDQISGPSRETMTFGIWQGANASIAAEFKGSCCDAALTFFRDFTFRERASGAYMTPETTGAQFARDASLAPRVVAPIPGYGLLAAAERTPAQSQRVPSWSGRRVEGGQLYSAGGEDHHHGRPHLVLVTPSAVAVILPEAALSESEAIEGAEGLQIEWASG